MLLWLLESEPEVCKKIFHDLFDRNSFDRILQFLEEDTHLLQEISIFSSLPYIPFFKAIYKMKHRILTGA
jgi:lycopene beta-cyclase